jgi:hypothetical protein
VHSQPAGRIGSACYLIGLQRVDPPKADALAVDLDRVSVDHGCPADDVSPAGLPNRCRSPTQRANTRHISCPLPNLASVDLALDNFNQNPFFLLLSKVTVRYLYRGGFLGSFTIGVRSSLPSA